MKAYNPKDLIPFIHKAIYGKKLGYGRDYISIPGSKKTVILKDILRYAQSDKSNDDTKSSLLANLQSTPARVLQKDADEIARTTGISERKSQFMMTTGQLEGESIKKNLRHWDIFMKDNIKFTDSNGYLTEEAKDIMREYGARSLDELFETMERKGDSYTYGNDTLRSDVQVSGWTVHADTVLATDPSNR